MTPLTRAGLLIAGVAFVACGRPNPATSTAELPVADTLVVTAPPDSLAAAPARDSLTAQPPRDSLAVQMDSLRAELARLTEAVQVLVQPARPDSSENGDSTLSDVGSLGLRVITALLVVFLVYALVRAIVWLLDTLAERNAARRLLYKRLIPIVRLVLWSMGIYMIVVVVFRVDQNGLLAAGAAVGVAVGFAAQDILKNIFGGMIIILDKPFQVGDKINVDGTYGEVVSIGLRATRIVTPDDNLVTVPNLKVVESQVANANAGALDCQVVVDLYLPGWVDVTKAKTIARDAAANSRYVYLEKPIVVNVKDEFKETFLTHLVVKAYVLDTRYEFAFASDVTEAAKIEFRKEKLIEPMWRPRVPPAPWEGGPA